MKLIKNILFLHSFLLLSCTGFAQKQTFDVISFTQPKGWQQQQNEVAVQLTVADQKTGAYAMVIITKAKPSAASADENFNSKWTAAIKGQIQVDGEPVMQPATQANGWGIVTGGSTYIDKGIKGKVALLSATGYGQTVSVVVMANGNQYEKDLAAVLNSLELSKVTQGERNNSVSLVQASTVAKESNSPLAGRLWEGTSTEKFTGAGTMTGYNTGGFATGQYQFDADGTYRFVNVMASHYTAIKSYQHETGTWSVNGNQLTISPANGQNEEWSKIGKTSNGNSDVTNRAINETWGKKLKTSSRKLEKYTYTFSNGPNGNRTTLVLQRNGRTEREGEGRISYFNETPVEKSVSLPGN
ncbi:lipocalin family protein [Pedobacter sp. KR3-3]|uniref:Lipocalin family protein n=1 Tax=Pedobacter albus TaxID=3113905 RepID=A0ABU7I6Z5_9SPHI|nr:lipocalin family protein [Pedobacter sp. KR3-3]MEE1945242.1 lipocalin family protein [Pedobacter sp. KR3-3]